MTRADPVTDIGQLDVLVEEFAERIRDGDNPEIEDYVRRHPDFADQIREMFPMVVAMEKVAVVNEASTVPSTPSRLGDYRILREIGRGGMGVVYEAVQESLDRQVALKVLPATVAGNVQYLVRFRREVRAVGKLHHTNIVPVFGAGEADGVHFYAMQFIPGSDLEQLSKEIKRLRKQEGNSRVAENADAANTTVEVFAQATTDFGLGRTTLDVYPYRVAEIAAQAADALAHAHSLGILHRDVKPSNLLLDGKGVLWVTDFGLAKVDEHDDFTATGDVVGTLRYMAPERFLGKADARSDVYSLGVTLYELITLQPAFYSSDRAQLMREVLDCNPKAPRMIDAKIPRDLETIIQKAMAKEPERRFATAKALADDLRRFVAGEPIVARPISRVEHFMRRCRKHPGMTIALTSLVVLGIVSVVVVLWQWRVAVAALESEATARKEAVTKGQQAIASQQSALQSLHFNRINLAHNEWLAGNVGHAKQLLSECPESMRHWEWGYVRRLCDVDLLRLDLERIVYKVAYSPNGRIIATCSGGHQWAPPFEVALWDASSGKKLWSQVTASIATKCVAFSPDSRLLAIAYSRDIAEKSIGPRTVLWDIALEKTLLELENQDSWASEIAFSPNGRYIVTASNSQVAAHDAKTGKRIFTGDIIGNHDIFGLAFSPDNDRFVSVGHDGLGRVWSIESRKQIASLACNSDTRAVAWSPDDTRIATASWNGVVRIWNAKNYKQGFEFWRHASPVMAVGFSPDGRTIASSDYMGFIRVWAPSNGREIATVRGHTGSINTLMFSPTGQRLITGGDDHLVRVWNAMDFSQESSVISPNWGSHKVVFTHDNRYIVAAGHRTSYENVFDPGIRILTNEPGAAMRYIRAHSGPCCTIAISADGRAIASGGDDRSVKTWELATSQPIEHFANAHDDKVLCVDFNRSSNLLASASADKTVKVWNLQTKKLEFEPLVHSAPVYGVTFSGDGNRIFTCDDSGDVCIWDSLDGRKIGTLNGHSGWVRSLAVSADGSMLASAGEDCMIRLWELKTPGIPTLTQTLKGHTDRILSIGFSLDNRRLVSGSWDRTAKVWDVASGSEAITLRADANCVSAVTFSPDGNTIVTSCNGLRRWDSAECTEQTKQQLALAAENIAQSWHKTEAENCMGESPRNMFGWLFHKACEKKQNLER